ncbi:hypothetical protein OH807_03450 [Kitasatospora sp. NBC_01560]|uniref:hypothetical protein n=1 Tax=Kitasatospora sp. NBC_01560 TaxID=2975965 RepID=UPI00386EA16F
MNRLKTLAVTVTAIAATALAATPAQAAESTCSSTLFGGQFYCGGAYGSGETAVVSLGGDAGVFVIGLDHAVWFRTGSTGWASLGGDMRSKVRITKKTADNTFTIGSTDANNIPWYRDFTPRGWGSYWYTQQKPST